LVRSINTSIVALLPIIAIIFVGAFLLGASTLLDLAVALAIGMVAGTFSSIFIATPVLAQLKSATPEMKSLETRVKARRVQIAKKALGEDSETTPTPEKIKISNTARMTESDSVERVQPRKQPRSKRKKGS